MGLSVVGVELLVDEKHWCTGMVEIGAGPKNAFLFVDSFISDAVIIGDSAAGGDAKLLKNVGWILERKILCLDPADVRYQQ